MSVQIRGSTTGGSNTQEIENTKGARVTLVPGSVGASGGRYRASMKTDLTTLIALKVDGITGQVASFRWGSATKVCLIERIQIDATMVTDFTTLQQFSFGAFFARSFTVAPGATGSPKIAVLTVDSLKTRTGYPTTVLSDFRVSSTAVLSGMTIGASGAGLASDPFLSVVGSAPSAGATVEKSTRTAIFEAVSAGGPIVLAQDEGFVVANTGLLMGAAGTAVIGVTVDWREYLLADLPAL